MAFSLYVPSVWAGYNELSRRCVNVLSDTEKRDEFFSFLKNILKTDGNSLFKDAIKLKEILRLSSVNTNFRDPSLDEEEGEFDEESEDARLDSFEKLSKFFQDHIFSSSWSPEVCRGLPERYLGRPNGGYGEIPLKKDLLIRNFEAFLEEARKENPMLVAFISQMIGGVSFERVLGSSGMPYEFIEECRRLCGKWLTCYDKTYGSDRGSNSPIRKGLLSQELVKFLKINTEHYEVSYDDQIIYINPGTLGGCLLVRFIQPWSFLDQHEFLEYLPLELRPKISNILEELPKEEIRSLIGCIASTYLSDASALVHSKQYFSLISKFIDKLEWGKQCPKECKAANPLFWKKVKEYQGQADKKIAEVYGKILSTWMELVGPENGLLDEELENLLAQAEQIQVGKRRKDLRNDPLGCFLMATFRNEPMVQGFFHSFVKNLPKSLPDLSRFIDQEVGAAGLPRFDEVKVVPVQPIASDKIKEEGDSPASYASTAFTENNGNLTPSGSEDDPNKPLKIKDRRSSEDKSEDDLKGREAVTVQKNVNVKIELNLELTVNGRKIPIDQLFGFNQAEIIGPILAQTFETKHSASSRRSSLSDPDSREFRKSK